MAGLATGSDVDGEFFPDMELVNDLEAGTLAAADAGLPEIYGQMVIMNRLLGIIIALIIVTMIFGLVRFTMHLVQDNITNQI